MSDLLAKCDWDGDELHVELPQWPEVVYVWVDEKTMPYAPAVADVRSLRAENAKLRELIRHMWRCMNNEYTEIGLDFICSRCGECEYDNGTGECDFERYVTELGIEVRK